MEMARSMGLTPWTVASVYAGGVDRSETGDIQMAGIDAGPS